MELSDYQGMLPEGWLIDADVYWDSADEGARYMVSAYNRSLDATVRLRLPLSTRLDTAVRRLVRACSGCANALLDGEEY